MNIVIALKMVITGKKEYVFNKNKIGELKC